MKKDLASTSTFGLLLGLWAYFKPHRRMQLFLLLVVMFASGGSELLSLGAVFPFLAVLNDPEKLWHQRGVQNIANSLGYTEASQLVLPSVLAFATAAIFAALIRLINLWLNGRLAAAVGSDLSCDAYRRTLYQPYSFFLDSNSASAITTITTQIARTIQALTIFLQLITSAIVSIALLAGLFLIDAGVALGAALLFGSVYALLAVTSRKELHRNSHMISLAAKFQMKTLKEGFGAIRDVLLDGNQQTYVEIYRRADFPQRQLQARNLFLSLFPRYVVEALALVSIACLGGFLVLQQPGEIDAIPLLGALGLGAQRLLPSLQQTYGRWSTIKGFNADLIGVLAMLKQPMPPIVSIDGPLQLRKNIRFQDVTFRYASEQKDVLKNLDLVIHRGERIGLVGTTGSGKTTMVDIMMGLLYPTEGRVLIDGEDLHDPAHPERIAAWRATIAHVPQSIYLADSTIAENIAFGIPIQNIDMKLVEQAAKQAQLSEFIQSTSGGYQSSVGECGIRLSGGQKQRIGIARALYKKAQVLVFDEATSALDMSTETAVMDSLYDLSNDLTFIIVAHRVDTLKKCNRIIELK
jgi:ABC-type multidrug transport system fused ATPase/permease subunit